MNVYITSDLHLGHKLAAKLRGFNSVEEHDESIIETLKQQCSKRTVLWVLGDVAMNRDSLGLLSNVGGRKKLVRGNHDIYPIVDYLSIFEDIHGILKYKNMWLSHCPIHPQEMYRCKANIHGHIHKGAATPELAYPYINVNWDFWGRAVSLNEIKEIIENKQEDNK